MSGGRPVPLSLNAAPSKGTGADVRARAESQVFTVLGVILHGSETQGHAVISILAKA